MEPLLFCMKYAQPQHVFLIKYEHQIPIVDTRYTLHSTRHFLVSTYRKTSNKTCPPIMPEFQIISQFFIALKLKKLQLLAQKNWKKLLVLASLI